MGVFHLDRYFAFGYFVVANLFQHLNNNTMANAYQSLSLKDLMDARDAFHLHLMNKQNVVATAIGKYRQRIRPGKDAKTLANTQVKADSWPCILVFVDQWVPFEEFRNAARYENLDSYIPSAVYMPDGRMVPLCVVKVTETEASSTLVAEEELVFPSDFVGGGYPLIIESQGIERVASIGCIVSDGNKYYALTNRHVTGAAGTVIYTKVKGTMVPIGVSSNKHIGNVAFDRLYKGWPSSNMVTNVDVGLIEISDLTYWKTAIFGLGALGGLYDLNTSNLTLDLIGSPVKAFGGVSGLLVGEISAFFYRYKSVGGVEYVSDLLIGPKDQAHPLNTKHGDSGTIWVLEEMEKQPASPKGRNAPDGTATVLRPIAIQWGQHCFVENYRELQYTFALGTCLSNVLRELEIDLVSGWNSESGYTWGEVGHYTIANIAADLVTNAQLRQLMTNNLDLITFDKSILKTDSAIKKARKTLNYTPLADVPDLVWKLIGGEFKRPLENPNHFADMDKPDSNNETLLDLCTGKGDAMKFLSPAEWLSYYTDKNIKDPSKGILPFRVWQIFLQMVKFASGGDAAGFVAAAGVLAHYVGDACQPLHISYMFNGKPTANGVVGKGVHEAFETKLVNKHNVDIMNSVATLIKQPEFKTLLSLKSGKQAAAATVDLMKETFAAINPETIVDAFSSDTSGFVDNFWASTGQDLLPKLFADGAFTLASLWNSAWVLGGGSQQVQDLGAIDPDSIRELYEKEDFLPSRNINGIGQFIDVQPATNGSPTAKKAVKKKKPAKKKAAPAKR